MPALSQQERQSVDQALDFVLRLLDCLDRVPQDKNTLQTGQADVIRKTTRALKKMLADGKIDWRDGDEANEAETDRNGIHLNRSSAATTGTHSSCPATSTSTTARRVLRVAVAAARDPLPRALPLRPPRRPDREPVQG